MSDAVSVSKADMTLLIDKCTDGALTADEAEALSVALRRDDDKAQWILNELELAGLISEVFCKTKVEDFVRGFCERGVGRERNEREQCYGGDRRRISMYTFYTFHVSASVSVRPQSCGSSHEGSRQFPGR